MSHGLSGAKLSSLIGVGGVVVPEDVAILNYTTKSYAKATTIKRNQLHARAVHA